ncbi:hypothetical protein PR003_g25369 [Phytophthora rubi]|uniref:RxLR effector protein n=1 Tax=Phytophthora rubi TaxID=129364 RepID=A0A6A3ICH3_9STRA|nr:hypothetical protein PR002_g24509 [Phytophthora rubi]KAE8980759.1 hypothetical protein PR001_g24196 [Phytophthora rubi]KAE9290127.1 hypothetical protein PR003_g25369 [Phytophthora rubi]
MRFNLLVFGALIATMAGMETVAADSKCDVAMAASRMAARELNDFTADEEERLAGRGNSPGESNHQTWWPNFKKWFKKTFYFWERPRKDSTRRLR